MNDKRQKALCASPSSGRIIRLSGCAVLGKSRTDHAGSKTRGNKTLSVFIGRRGRKDVAPDVRPRRLQTQTDHRQNPLSSGEERLSMHGCWVEIIVQIERPVSSSATVGLAKGFALRKWNGLENENQRPRCPAGRRSVPPHAAICLNGSLKQAATHHPQLIELPLRAEHVVYPPGMVPPRRRTYAGGAARHFASDWLFHRGIQAEATWWKPSR